MSGDNFLFEYRVKGLVVSYIYEDLSNPYSSRMVKQCCLLNQENFNVNSFMMDLNINLNHELNKNKKKDSSLIDLRIFNPNYIQIEVDNEIYTPQIKITSSSLGRNGTSIFLALEDTNESLENYLLNNFLGKIINIHYVQADNSEILQKFLLDTVITQPNKTNKLLKV